MPGRRHERIVKSLGLPTNGWARATAMAIERDEISAGNDVSGWPKGTLGPQLLEDLPRVRPDAYEIEEPERRLTLYEVEDTGPLNEGKRAAYVEVFWLLDAYSWTLRIVRVDRYGVRSEFPVLAAVLEDVYQRAGFEGEIVVGSPKARRG